MFYQYTYVSLRQNITEGNVTKTIVYNTINIYITSLLSSRRCHIILRRWIAPVINTGSTQITLLLDTLNVASIDHAQASPCGNLESASTAMSV